MVNIETYKDFLEGRSELTYEELPVPDQSDNIEIYMYGLCGVSQNVVHGPDHYVPAAKESAERAEIARLEAEDIRDECLEVLEQVDVVDITTEELDEFCQ